MISGWQSKFAWAVALVNATRAVRTLVPVTVVNRKMGRNNNKVFIRVLPVKSIFELLQGHVTSTPGTEDLMYGLIGGCGGTDSRQNSLESFRRVQF